MYNTEAGESQQRNNVNRLNEIYCTVNNPTATKCTRIQSNLGCYST